MGNNYYFIEGSTEKDIIGFKSYINSLNTVINNDSKFIGLISEFGTGKSSLIKMLSNTKSENKPLEVITINLWNCDESNKSQLDIHQVFLHQLIDKLDIKTKDYYKKKINKKYRLFDIKFGFKRKLYIYLLFLIYIFSAFEALKIINLFPSELYRIIYYFLLSILTILCVLLYKPILSFNKDKSDNCIDENDTKDLYVDIINEYFSTRKNKNKRLIICLEELDRFSDYQVVIKHIKEFYKFYKLNPNHVTFIIAIKSANSLAENVSEEKIKVTNVIKNTYEKVFDYILNMNSVNIQDYDSILLELIDEKKDDLPDGIKVPNINKIGAWRYLYLGKKITVRDLKHRYNYAISLYLSAQESGVKKVDFDKCLYISYLEDEYNSLYYKLTSDSSVINDILLYYAKNKNLENYLHKEIKFENEEKEIILDGIIKKYINVDYAYYFFKFPKNKTPYSIYELNLHNAILFNENSANLDNSLDELTDSEIKNILKKRIDEKFLPDIVFDHKRLIKIEFENEKNSLMNTIDLKYNLISNYSSFETLVNKIRLIDKIRYKHIFEEYFLIKKNEISNLQPDLKSQLRLKLAKLFMVDSCYFAYMFKENNEIITSDEIKAIDDLKVINRLTNGIININYISSIKNVVKNEKYKKNILDLLEILSNNEGSTNELYYDLFDSIDFSKYEGLSDADIKKIYKLSYNKLQLGNYERLQYFIKKVGKYNIFLDDELIKIVDITNDIQVKGYINVIQKHHFISDKGLELIDKCTKKYSLDDDILSALYNKGYYDTYIISRSLNKGLFEYEVEKKNVLAKYYIDYFQRKKDWNKKVSTDMVKFLYDNVNYSELSTSQLGVFVSCDQNQNIINAVLNAKNYDFINEYISKITSFRRGDRKEIFNMVAEYHKDNKLTKKAKNNMKLLAGNNKAERNLFDDRRH